MYLQQVGKDQSLLPDSMIRYASSAYRIKYKDILDVKIKTTVPEMNAIFGLEDPVAKLQQLNAANITQGDIYYTTGYGVDEKGEIRLPFIGKIKVDGLRIEEAETAITHRLSTYFKQLSAENLYVRVKLGGIGFSTFGEFNKPGRYMVLQERMTIFDAIATSGDLTTLAKRSQVMVLRQYPEGTKIHELNLNDRNILRSPYYFIQPNDQIYAAPLKNREFGTGTNAAQVLQVLISTLSLVVLAIGLTK